MLKKRGQGLSLNVIIISAVVLIVLVVLWAIFTGRMGVFSQGLAVCRGSCVASSNCQAKAVEGVCGPSSNTVEGVEWYSTEEVVCCLMEK